MKKIRYMFFRLAPILFSLIMFASCGAVLQDEPDPGERGSPASAEEREAEVPAPEQPADEERHPPIAYDEGLYALIEVKEGYRVEDFGESFGPTYHFSVFCLRSLTNEHDLYWEIVVKQEGEVVDILRVDREEYGATIPAAEIIVSEWDVNFDGVGDVLICLGHFGTQGALLYKCYLTLGEELVHCPSFTDILNPAIDADSRQILASWRNWAASHSWGIYTVQDNVFVLTQRLTEEPVELAAAEEEIVWGWTDEVLEDGQWVVRDYDTAMETSEDEIREKLYGASSRWGIGQDRWISLYRHNGGEGEASLAGS